MKDSKASAITYIEGLDFLFGGGVKRVNGKNPCILLQGDPGSGKTTLALQIAIRRARATRGMAIVFSIEQAVDSLRKKAESLNLIRERGKSVLLLSGSEKDINIGVKSKYGCVFLLSASPDDFRVMGASIGSNIIKIKKRINEARLKEKRTKGQRIRGKQIVCIIVDSLSAVKGEMFRDEFLILNQKCSKNASLSIFVDEGCSDDGCFALQEYISDIVVRLGCRYRSERKDYLERYIEIVKARNQFHYRGKHPFSIVDPTKKAMETGKDKSKVEGGVYVYPSMGARLAHQLRETEKCEKKKREGERKRFRFGIGTLDRLVFGGSEQEEGGVVEESTTLVIGERGTKKTVIGLHFLAAGIGEEEKCLLVSLKDDDAAIRAVAGGYKTLRPHFCEKNEYLEIKHIRPSYLTPGNFLDQINSWLEASEREGKKTERVVFDNFAQIRIRFPLLDAERMFIPTLVDLFKTKGITSLFIDIVEEPGKAVWEYKSPILDLADYVIATQHLAFLGRDHTVITVRRSMEGKYNAEPAELRREEDRIVVDEHAFDGITGVLEKDPKPAEIFIKLFQENKPEKLFTDEIEKEFKEKYKEKVHVSSFSRGDSAREYGRIGRYWIESPNSIVRVVSLDEHWIRYAADQGMLWKIEEKWFAEEEGKDWLKKETSDFLSGALGPARDKGCLYAIPNHLDMGLFCYRKDLFKSVFGTSKPVPSDLCELLQLILSKYKEIKKRKLCGFGFDMESEETLVCTFFEFLLNTSIGKDKAGERFYRVNNKGEHEPLIFGDSDLREAAVQALKIMRSLVESEVMPYPCTLEHCKNAILSRHWYSTFAYVFCDLWQSVDKAGKPRRRAKYKEAKIGIVPVQRGGEKGGNESVDHYSCSGSWYLGILKKSLRPRLGFHLIGEITSMGRNFRRYELGAGLPTRKSFYKFHGKQNVTFLEGVTYKEVMESIEGKQGCLRKVCRRESICGNNVRLYHSIRSGIAEIILDVLGGERSPDEGINELTRLIKEGRSSGMGGVTNVQISLAAK